MYYINEEDNLHATLYPKTVTKWHHSYTFKVNSEK